MNKSIFIRHLSIALLLASGLISCASTKDSKAPSAHTGDKASVQILSTSDLHGWFVPWDFATDTESTKGSMTYLATLINQHRKDNANVILVDAGDAVQANYVEYFIDHKVNPMVDAMNYLKYDVWTFGNHEYNFTAERRANLIKQSKAAVLSGNVYNKKDGKRYLPATAVVERNGIKIGFIGFTTPLIASFEEGKESLATVNVHNPLDEVNSAIKELQSKHVDAIVGLMHMGLDEENSVKGSSITDIANAYPQFTAIIGGHAHAKVDSKEVNGVLLMEPWYYGRVLGVMDLGFEKTDSGWKVISKTSKNEACGSAADPGLAKEMDPFKQELHTYVNTPIGTLANADLHGTDEIKGISNVYVQGSGIINLLGHAGMYYSGAQCTILCTDYETAGFPAGPVSIKDISSAYSFSGGEISVYDMTGKQLKQLLEWSAGYFNTINEGDLTISYNPDRRASKYSSNFTGTGITYTVNLTKPQGSRIENLSLITDYSKDGTPVLDNGVPHVKAITDDMTVKVGTNNYYIKQWVDKGGCLEGQTLKPSFSSSDTWGDDGTVRALAIRYITEVLKGKIDGNAFAYKNWDCYTGVDKNSDIYKKAVEQINSGKIRLPVSDKGRTNIAPVTVKDVQ